MELTTIKNLVIRTELRIGDGPDDVLKLAYRIGAFAPEFWAWYYAADNPNPSIFEILERVLVETGITVDGEPVAPTAEAMRAAGVPVQIAKAIWDHIRNEAQAGKLGATS